MIQSPYLLQVVHRDTGDVVQTMEPGGRVETDIVEDVVVRMHAAGVGYLKSSAAVEAAVRVALREALRALKKQVRPDSPRSS